MRKKVLILMVLVIASLFTLTGCFNSEQEVQFVVLYKGYVSEEDNVLIENFSELAEFEDVVFLNNSELKAGEVYHWYCIFEMTAISKGTDGNYMAFTVEMDNNSALNAGFKEFVNGKGTLVDSGLDGQSKDTAQVVVPVEKGETTWTGFHYVFYPIVPDATLGSTMEELTQESKIAVSFEDGSNGNIEFTNETQSFDKAYSIVPIELLEPEVIQPSTIDDGKISWYYGENVDYYEYYVACESNNYSWELMTVNGESEINVDGKAGDEFEISSLNALFADYFYDNQTESGTDARFRIKACSDIIYFLDSNVSDYIEWEVYVDTSLETPTVKKLSVTDDDIENGYCSSDDTYKLTWTSSGYEDYYQIYIKTEYCYDYKTYEDEYCAEFDVSHWLCNSSGNTYIIYAPQEDDVTGLYDPTVTFYCESLLKEYAEKNGLYNGSVDIYIVAYADEYYTASSSSNTKTVVLDGITDIPEKELTIEDAENTDGEALDETLAGS